MALPSHYNFYAFSNKGFWRAVKRGGYVPLLFEVLNTNFRFHNIVAHFIIVHAMVSDMIVTFRIASYNKAFSIFLLRCAIIQL